jgi:hypothetical protein
MDNDDEPLTPEEIEEMNNRIRDAARDAQVRQQAAQRIRGLMMEWNQNNGVALTDGFVNWDRDRNTARKMWVYRKLINSIPNDEVGPKSNFWGNPDPRDPPAGSAMEVYGGKTRRRYKKKSRRGYKKKSRRGYKKSRRGRK